MQPSHRGSPINWSQPRCVQSNRVSKAQVWKSCGRQGTTISAILWPVQDVVYVVTSLLIAPGQLDQHKLYAGLRTHKFLAFVVASVSSHLCGESFVIDIQYSMQSLYELTGVHLRELLKIGFFSGPRVQRYCVLRNTTALPGAAKTRPG